MIGVVPNLLERSHGLIEMTLRNDPNVSQYRILAHRNFTTGISSGWTELFTVKRGAMFRSKTLRKKGLGLTMDSNRGLTRMAFDISDFADGGGGAAPTVPFEEETIYLVVQEFSKATGAYLDHGPILVIPPTGFFNIRNPLLQLSGTAPSTPNCTLGDPLPLPVSGSQLHLAFPFYSQTNNIRNLEPASGNDLFYSSGNHMGASKIPAASDFGLTAAAYSELILAGSGGDVEFNIALGVATLV